MAYNVTVHYNNVTTGKEASQITSVSIVCYKRSITHNMFPFDDVIMKITYIFSMHCYLPKFTFWQECWFNGLSVCLILCPGLYKITDNSRTLWDIFTKISQQMYLGCSSIVISFQGQRSKVKVTRSPQRSKLEIAVTPLIFELQQNLKNHNVVLLKAHLYAIINFRYHFRFKRSPEVENRKCEIAISIFVSFQYSSNLIAYLETTCQI